MLALYVCEVIFKAPEVDILIDTLGQFPNVGTKPRILTVRCLVMFKVWYLTGFPGLLLLKHQM